MGVIKYSQGIKFAGSNQSKSRGISTMNFMETFDQPLTEFQKKRYIQSKIKKSKKGKVNKKK